MTQEEKAKRYDEAYKKVAVRFGSNVADEIFPELKESEDERIRKDMIETIKKEAHDFPSSVIAEKSNSWIAWLEKQGEHAKFRDSIQVGDKVTRNQDGMLVNLSQLNRVAKKQGEQKHAWSEEDEKILDRVITNYESGYLPSVEKRDEIIEKLKSLKERYAWKPSDGQMEALEHFVRSIGESGYASPYDNNTKLLYSLLSDLKKLKE